MKLLPTIRLAGRALARNKMRAFLTALGIIIGVGAVIAMVAIGEGAKRRVQETFESMGTNLLIVLPGSANTGGMRGGFGSQPTITWGDLRAMQTELRAVRLAAPVLRMSAPVQGADQNWTTGIVGTTQDYFTIRSWPVAPRFWHGTRVSSLGAAIPQQEKKDHERHPERDHHGAIAGTERLVAAKTEPTNPGHQGADERVQAHSDVREESPDIGNLPP